MNKSGNNSKVEPTTSIEKNITDSSISNLEDNINIVIKPGQGLFSPLSLHSLFTLSGISVLEVFLGPEKSRKYYGSILKCNYKF